MAHKEIGFIKQKLFCLLPTFEIERNGKLMGQIVPKIIMKPGSKALNF